MFITFFNSCLLPKCGRSSKLTPTSSIKPSDVYRRKEISFNTLEECYEWMEEFKTTPVSVFSLY